MIILKEHYDNGGLYDRGLMDSYYGRGPKPHYYPNGTYKGQPVKMLSHGEVKIYMQGYNDNEADGDFKDWGDRC